MNRQLADLELMEVDSGWHFHIESSVRCYKGGAVAKISKRPCSKGNVYGKYTRRCNYRRIKTLSTSTNNCASSPTCNLHINHAQRLTLKFPDRVSKDSYPIHNPKSSSIDQITTNKIKNYPICNSHTLQPDETDDYANKIAVAALNRGYPQKVTVHWQSPTATNHDMLEIK